MTNQLKDPKPTPGAMRAAEKINIFFKTHRPVLTNDEIVESMVATIIDQETAAPELLEALQHLWAVILIEKLMPDTVSYMKAAEGAIKKAQGGQDV